MAGTSLLALIELVERVGQGLARGVGDSEVLEPRCGLAQQPAHLVEQGLPSGVERGAHGSSITTWKGRSFMGITRREAQYASPPAAAQADLAAG